MELPRATDPSGLFEYLMAGMAALIVLFGLYIGAVVAGLLPPPEALPTVYVDGPDVG